MKLNPYADALCPNCGMVGEIILFAGHLQCMHCGRVIGGGDTIRHLSDDEPKPKEKEPSWPQE